MSSRRIVVRRTIPADVETVWDALADIAAHVEWMANARAIRFVTRQTEGVGTTFDCDTKVGPIRLRDRMEITGWEPDRSMSVRHAGVVTGEGTFALDPTSDGTEVTWDETLHFPWWLPSLPAALALRVVWIRNLRRFERTLGVTGNQGARRRDRRRRRAP